MSLPSLSNFSIASIRNSLDEVRAQVYPKNETERKVYEALSSKNWGASSTLLNDIAMESLDYEKFGFIMTIIWNSLEVDGRSWQQIFKALTLIEYLIKNGSERVIDNCRDRIFKIKNLENFNYFEGNIDKGSGVREKSKQLTQLLGNNDDIRNEREKARALRNKFVGISNEGRNNQFSGQSYSSGSGGYDSRDTYSSGRYNDSTWNNSGGGNDSYNGGRYGNDSKGNKYSDEPPRNDTSHSSYNDTSHTNTFKSSSTDHDHHTKSTPSASKTTTSNLSNLSNSKLKLAIKKVEPKKTVESTTHKEEDLFSFDSQPAATTAATNNASFDPFGMAPTPPSAAPTVVSSTHSDLFDPFVSSSTTTTTSNSTVPSIPTATFDPFAVSSTPAPPVPSYHPPQAQTTHCFDPFATTPLQPSHVPPIVPSFPPVQHAQVQAAAAPMSSFTSFTPRDQMHQLPLNQYVPPPAIPPTYNTTSMISPRTQAFGSTASPAKSSTTTSNTEYGEFESATVNQSSSPVPAKNNTQQWGDLGKLVDLSSIAKNSEIKAAAEKSSSATSRDSFTGLDGFTKSNGGPGNNMMGAPGMYGGAAASHPSMQARIPGNPMTAGGMMPPPNAMGMGMYSAGAPAVPMSMPGMAPQQQQYPPNMGTAPGGYYPPQQHNQYMQQPGGYPPHPSGYPQVQGPGGQYPPQPGMYPQQGYQPRSNF